MTRRTRRAERSGLLLSVGGFQGAFVAEESEFSWGNGLGEIRANKAGVQLRHSTQRNVEAFSFPCRRFAERTGMYVKMI